MDRDEGGLARKRFPAAEARLPWLSPLLAAYALADASVRAALAASGRTAACRPGCARCCSQPAPATACEVAGLVWCAAEVLDPALRRVVRANMAGTSPACVFLVAGRCAAYALRPVACRRYVVLGAACGQGEDPALTRPEDVLAPDRAALREAHRLMLPYFGILDPQAQERALAEGLLLRQAEPLRDMEWSRAAAFLSGLKSGA